MNTTTLTAPAFQTQVPNLRAIAMRAIRAAFSTKASLIAAAVIAAVMYYHTLTIADTIAMQHAVAVDCLCASPWGIAWIIRNIRKGGCHARV